MTEPEYHESLREIMREAMKWDAEKSAIDATLSAVQTVVQMVAQNQANAFLMGLNPNLFLPPKPLTRWQRLKRWIKGTL